jgi:hypothetical protein
LFILAVFLELFGVFFLLLKLTIVPLVKLIQRRFFSNKNHSAESNGNPIQLTPVAQSPVSEASKKWTVKKKRTGNNNDVPLKTIF